MTRSSDPLAVDLAEAAEHFAHWRRTRRTSSGPTPAPLRERAVALLAAHRPSTVARVLGINTLMLERWSSAPVPDVDSPSAPPPFVALPDVSPKIPALEPPGPLPPDSSPELVPRWPGGGELVARGAIPHALVRVILGAFDPHTSAPAPEGAAR